MCSSTSSYPLSDSLTELGKSLIPWAIGGSGVSRLDRSFWLEPTLFVNSIDSGVLSAPKSLLSAECQKSMFATRKYCNIRPIPVPPCFLDLLNYFLCFALFFQGFWGSVGIGFLFLRVFSRSFCPNESKGRTWICIEYASNLYCSAFGAPELWGKGSTVSTPPIWIAVCLPYVSKCSSHLYHNSLVRFIARSENANAIAIAIAAGFIARSLCSFGVTLKKAIALR